jgi:hypothetical protein
MKRVAKRNDRCCYCDPEQDGDPEAIREISISDEEDGSSYTIWAGYRRSGSGHARDDKSSEKQREDQRAPK